MNRKLCATGLLSALSLTVAACAGPAIPRAGGEGPRPPSSSIPKGGTPKGSSPRAPRPSVTPPPIVRPVQQNNVIGNSAEALSRSLGRPRIDVTEGYGRKMQFLGTGCVLDVYFYPPTSGAAPVATHVDARSLDGRDIDVNRCADMLRRR